MRFMRTDFSLPITEKELAFRRKFKVKKFMHFELTCTNCGDDLTEFCRRNMKVPEHPYLGVPYCDACTVFYHTGDFSTDEDGEEKYCRWCGQGGALFMCSYCSCGFCSTCIKKNVGRLFYEDAKFSDLWKCLFCNVRPLWKLRYFVYLVSRDLAAFAGTLPEERSEEELQFSVLFREKFKAVFEPPESSKEVESTDSENLKVIKGKRKRDVINSSSEDDVSSDDRKNRRRRERKENKRNVRPRRSSLENAKQKLTKLFGSCSSDDGNNVISKRELRRREKARKRKREETEEDSSSSDEDKVEPKIASLRSKNRKDKTKFKQLIARRERMMARRSLRRNEKKRIQSSQSSQEKLTGSSGSYESLSENSWEESENSESDSESENGTDDVSVKSGKRASTIDSEVSSGELKDVTGLPSERLKIEKKRKFGELIAKRKAKIRRKSIAQEEATAPESLNVSNEKEGTSTEPALETQAEDMVGSTSGNQFASQSAAAASDYEDGSTDVDSETEKEKRTQAAVRLIEHMIEIVDASANASVGVLEKAIKRCGRDEFVPTKILKRVHDVVNLISGVAKVIKIFDEEELKPLLEKKLSRP